MNEHTDERKERHLKTIAVCLVLLVLILVLTNLSSFALLVRTLLRVASSILYGVLFAYLLNPLVRLADKLLRRPLEKLFKKKAGRRISRVVGLLFAFSVASLGIYLLIHNIAPKVGESIQDIINKMPGYYETVEKWVFSLLEDPDIRNIADVVMEKGYDYLDSLLNENLLGSAQKVVGVVTSSVFAVFRELVSMLIGLIVSIYVLLSKDKFLAQSKKIVVALCSPETADRVMDHGRQINRIFNGFIIGKIIDSIIIGILCYIGVSALRMPYPELLAIIIGITNVIPYFGPIIGAVPCAILVVMNSPLQCLYFLIFLLILQQVDGNIIGPRILGENVGISSFWILVAISVGGGLFGFGGMLLGVPVFAVIYMIISDMVNRALKHKGQTIRTDDYYAIRTVSELHDKETEVPVSGKEE
ncbi:MAG: AI-2E family transporter [Oscillospiraceae bacterium]|nr:AI-2E family transporter [Oscillospiraceae bacterium]